MTHQNRLMALNARSGATTTSRLCKCKRATTAIEYGLIAGLISIAITATLITIGSTLKNDWYQAVADAVAAAVGA